MNNKYLFLTENASTYPMVDGIDNFSIYKQENKILRAVRFLHHKLGVLEKFKSYWLDDWKHHLDRYDKIVICDSIFDYSPVEYIREKRPNARLLCCFRNRVKEHIDHSVVHRVPEILVSKYGCELWTYSKEDSEKYDMKLYDQYHLIPKELTESYLSIEQDVYFIGEDKHRLGQLIKLKKELDFLGLKSLIEVVADPNMQYSKEEKRYLVSPRPYSEVLNNVLQSRCVIDIVGKVNYGMTFRSLEASVLKKKLITNYKEIESADFYNRNNIFILGVDNASRMKEFILSPFDNTIEPKLDKYSYYHFCDKIFKS